MLDIVLSGQGLIGFREACPRMCHFSIWFIFNRRQFGLQRLKKSILTLTPFLHFLHLKKIRKKSCTRKTAIAKDNIFFFFLTSSLLCVAWQMLIWQHFIFLWIVFLPFEVSDPYPLLFGSGWHINLNCLPVRKPLFMGPLYVHN